MFSCEICELFKNTFFYRAHPVAASGNISWTLSLLHLRTMNGIISWYLLAPQRLFHFIAYVFRFFPFLSFFLISFVDPTTFWFGGNPANICLDKDVLMASWRCLSSSSSEDVFKMSSRRLYQDEYIRQTFSRRLQDALPRHLQNVFKRLQDVLQKRLQGIFKTFSRHLQDIFKRSSRRLEDVCKTPCKDLFKTFWKRIININCSY